MMLADRHRRELEKKKRDRVRQQSQLEHLRLTQIRKKMGFTKYYSTPGNRSDYDDMFPPVDVDDVDPTNALL